MCSPMYVVYCVVYGSYWWGNNGAQVRQVSFTTNGQLITEEVLL